VKKEKILIEVAYEISYDTPAARRQIIDAVVAITPATYGGGGTAGNYNAKRLRARRVSSSSPVPSSGIKLRTVRRTTRNDFDVDHLQKLLENDTLTHEDAKRILGEALHVVAALRGTVRAVDAGLGRLRELSRVT
jgi:hypothetical protein